MKREVRIAATLLVALLCVVLGGAPAAATTAQDFVVGQSDPRPVYRLAGPNRYATAVAISQERWTGQDADTTADVAVICSGANWPDGLVAAPLAIAMRGPVLFVGSASVPSVTVDEIARLGVSRIVIIGGTGAVVPQVELTLRRLPVIEAVERIGGVDRYETASLVARRLVQTDSFASRRSLRAPRAFVVTGENFPDALASAALSYPMGAPLILSRRDALPAASQSLVDYLGTHDYYLAGGTGAISDAVAHELWAEPNTTYVYRVAGQDRYDTATELVEFCSSQEPYWFSTLQVGVASGEVFPDALAAAALFGDDAWSDFRGPIMLLTRWAALPESVTDFLSARSGFSSTGSEAWIAGGEGVVSADVEDELARLGRP